MAAATSINAVPCSAGRPKRRSQRRGASTVSVRASGDASSKPHSDHSPLQFRSSKAFHFTHGLTAAFALLLLRFASPSIRRDSRDAAGLRRGQRAQRAQRHPPPRLRHPRRAQPGGHPRRRPPRLPGGRRLRLSHGRPHPLRDGRRAPRVHPQGPPLPRHLPRPPAALRL